MNSKRFSDASSSSTSKKKKQSNLTIAQKVELLKKYDQGTSVHGLCAEFEIGKSTAYDIIKKKDEILSFFADSDSPFEMAKRKTTRGARNADHDKIMIQWFKQRRSENVPLTGPLIMAQAAKFHAELGLTTPCDYTTGWLDKFKKRHGIRQVRICGEKVSADTEAAEIFINDITELIEKGVSLNQIYNADETALFWRYVPRKTLALRSEENPSGVKDFKERITILACANASGSHKLKLLIIGKSAKPRAFTGVKVFPVIYKANKRAWSTKEIFIDWYKNNFLPEVRKYYESISLSTDEDIYLILDNCSAHSVDESDRESNTMLKFMPPNCTSILQPMDNGILRALKCRYKHDFLRRMLDTVNDEKSILDFIKEFNIRDALWCAANAWTAISQETLRNAWHTLIPQSRLINDDDESDNAEFVGFKMSKEKMQIMDLLSYAKSRSTIELEESDIMEVMDCDDDAPTLNKLSDTEIIDSVLNDTNGNRNEDDESDVESPTEEKISTEKLVDILGTALKGLEQRNFISKEEILTVYKIREKLIQQKPKLKQQTLLDMFKK